MKKNWLQLVSLALNVALLVCVIGLRDQVETAKDQLSERIRGVEDSVEDISSTVRQELEQSTRLLAEDYRLETTGLDPAARAVTAEVSVTLRQWREDTEVLLLVKQGETREQVPMTPAGDGTFTAPLTLPTAGEGMVELEVAATSDGTTAKEYLDSWADVSDLLPLCWNGWGNGGISYEEGMLTARRLDSDFSDRESGDSIPAEDVAFRLYRNGALAAEEPGQLDESLLRENWYTYDCDELTAAAEPGDQLRLTVFCRDQYGLGYEFTMKCWNISENGELEDAALNDTDCTTALQWE
jgi:uncharacterized protein YoxC